MFLPLVTRPNILININSVANNVNLRARANSPSYPLNVFCLVNANITSNSANTPALRTGFGWANSTYIVIRNSANIVGNIGVTGISGSGGAGGPGAGYPTNPVAAGSAGGTGGVGANGSPGFQAEANTSNVGIINYSSNSNTFVSNANTNWIGTNSSWTWGVSGDNLEGGGSLGPNIRTTIYYNFDINANVPFTLEYKLVSASSANAAGTVGIYRTQDQGNIGSTSGNFYAAGMFSATSTHWVGGVDPAPTVGLAIVHSAASADVVQEKGANVHSLTSNVSAANVFSLVREIDGVLKVYRDGVLLKTHPESAAGNMRFVVNSTAEGNFLRLDYLKLHQYPYTFPGTNATSFVIVMNNQGSIIGGTGGPGGTGGGGGGGGGGSAKQGLTEQQFKEANKLTLVAGSAAGAYTDLTAEREGEWLMAAGGSLSDRDDLDLSGVSAEDKKTYSNFKLGEEKIVRTLDTFSQARKTPVSTNKIKLLEKGYKDLGDGLALTSGVMSNAEMSGVENALNQLGSFLQEAGVDIP